MVISVVLGGALIVGLVMLLAASQSGQVRRRPGRSDGSPAAVSDSGDSCDSGSAGDGGCDGGGGD